jgi:hypothetical protein
VNQCSDGLSIFGEIAIWSSRNGACRSGAASCRSAEAIEPAPDVIGGQGTGGGLSGAPGSRPDHAPVGRRTGARCQAEPARRLRELDSVSTAFPGRDAASGGDCGHDSTPTAGTIFSGLSGSDLSMAANYRLRPLITAARCDAACNSRTGKGLFALDAIELTAYLAGPFPRRKLRSLSVCVQPQPFEAGLRQIRTRCTIRALGRLGAFEKCLNELWG